VFWFRAHFNKRMSNRPDVLAWSQHWSASNQRTPAQQFFSFYRKAVFARAVGYYFRRFFSLDGIFVEVGAGTSETSMRIEKHDGHRELVAVDIVPAALVSGHPIMDVRIAADAFQLPWRDASLHGVWNVGVMEHLTSAEIGRMMQEFYRVLAPGGRVFLLWPGEDSIPQRLLQVLERIANMRRDKDCFRFHPAEISRLRSLAEGRDILSRNGFRVLHVDSGLRSLFAFKTLIGEKPPMPT
jgi:ubiquinone/menaquinone biosynthesis C-methylase UbiE